MEIARRGGASTRTVKDLAPRRIRSRVARRESLAAVASYGITRSSQIRLWVERRRRDQDVARHSAWPPGSRCGSSRHFSAPTKCLSTTGRARPIGTVHRLVIHEMLPVVGRESWPRSRMCFCETGVYTVDESRTILSAARAHGLRLKLHAMTDVVRRRGAGREIGATSAITSRRSPRPALRPWRPREQLPSFCRHDALSRKPTQPCAFSDRSRVLSRWPRISIQERHRAESAIRHDAWSQPASTIRG